MEYQRLPECREGEIRLHPSELQGFYYGGNPAGEMGWGLLLRVLSQKMRIHRPFLIPSHKIVAIID